MFLKFALTFYGHLVLRTSAGWETLLGYIIIMYENKIMHMAITPKHQAEVILIF